MLLCAQVIACSDCRPAIASSCQPMTIPRLIHQTFSDWNNLKPELAANVRSIREQNQDFHHCFYNDHDIVDFIRANYGMPMLRAYERINPNYGASRADLFRYLCLYRMGGVYLDIKTSVARQFSEVLESNDEFILSQWDRLRFPKWGSDKSLAHIPGGEFQQWYIIAEPAHPFLKAVIDRVLVNIAHYNPFKDGTGPAAVIRVTGPAAYTLAIEPLLGHHRHRFVDSKQDLGLDYSIYAASSDHFSAFPGHYTQLCEPLIMVNPPLRWSFSLARLAKRASRRLLARD
jgi:hypothetical protein